MSEAHLNRVRALPCSVAGCGQGSVAHHAFSGSMQERSVLKGAALRVSDFLAIPLCPHHHNGADGVHSGVLSWESRHGTQASMVDGLCRVFGVDLWQLALDEAVELRANRKYKPPQKQPKPDVDKEPLTLGRMKFGGKIRSAGFAKVERERTDLSSSKILKRQP